jgi:hypothetical protein
LYIRQALWASVAVAKEYVATAGGPDDAGISLYAEALRHGLELAKRV